MRQQKSKSIPVKDRIELVVKTEKGVQYFKIDVAFIPQKGGKVSELTTILNAFSFG